MGRKSIKELRRKEIVKAFYKVAQKEGLENASIAKVARQLDINPSLVMHYYNTKDTLIDGLIDYILERYRYIYKPEKRITDRAERLEKIIDNLFSRKWGTLFDDSVFYSCYALIFRNEKIRQRFKKLHDSLRTFLAEEFREAMEDGTIEIEDPVAAADMVFILVEGAYYYLGLSEDKNEEKLAVYKNEVLLRLKLKVNHAERSTTVAKDTNSSRPVVSPYKVDI